MNRMMVAVNMKVQCADGSTHDSVTLAVEDAQRIYLAADGSTLDNVESIEECVSLLPPMALAAVLSRCKENSNG